MKTKIVITLDLGVSPKLSREKRELAVVESVAGLQLFMHQQLVGANLAIGDVVILDAAVTDSREREYDEEDEFEKIPPGVYFECNRGIYNLVSVYKLALNNGMSPAKEELQFFRPKDGDMQTVSDDDLIDYEHLSEITEEALEFLSKHCVPDGHYFGCTENSDWGVFPIEEEGNMTDELLKD